MRRMLEKILRCYGTEVTIHHKGIHSVVRAFFMPTASRSWQNMEHVYTPLGETPRGQYNYIGPAEPVAEMGDVLEVGGRSYLLRRLEVIEYDSAPVYRWGLCVENGGIDGWGS